MKLVKKGAEADIYRTSWCGRAAILKVRKPKTYRLSQLDAKIRRQRTVRESHMISYARALGIPTPLVYFVDVGRSAIVMQHVRGTVVQRLPDMLILSLSYRMGRMIGTLHKNAVMHGDLTTSNFVYEKTSDMLYLIDFGLSQNTPKPEDHAVDLRLIKEIFNSAHASIISDAWKNLMRGYTSSVGHGQSSRIKQLVSEIEGRGRYATVV